MNQEDFVAHINRLHASCEAVLIGKGREYSGPEDCLSNFKRGAALTGATPLQVAFIYMSKHYDAIATYVQDDARAFARGHTMPVLTESIESRLIDLINYATLIAALISESEK